mgnify:CR=1 FL=1
MIDFNYKDRVKCHYNAASATLKKHKNPSAVSVASLSGIDLSVFRGFLLILHKFDDLIVVSYDASQFN